MASINPDRTVSALTLTAQGSGTVNSADMDGGAGTGIVVFINITAISGTSPTLTVTLQGKDKVSGAYYTILASTALNATGITVLRVFPSLTAVANTTANDIIPPDFRIQAVVGGTTPSVTATISVAVSE